ncbi:MAG TPA: hypothetical protein VM422_15075, partial [Amaricoccus sp.]|nr:hypothetical protein [Amaricoccus sp.]
MTCAARKLPDCEAPPAAALFPAPAIPTPVAAPATGVSGVLVRLARSGAGERVSFGDLIESFEIGAYGPLIVLF